jgi:hypothetical protein
VASRGDAMRMRMNFIGTSASSDVLKDGSLDGSLDDAIRLVQSLSGDAGHVNLLQSAKSLLTLYKQGSHELWVEYCDETNGRKVASLVPNECIEELLRVVFTGGDFVHLMESRASLHHTKPWMPNALYWAERARGSSG